MVNNGASSFQLAFRVTGEVGSLPGSLLARSTSSPPPRPSPVQACMSVMKKAAWHFCMYLTGLGVQRGCPRLSIPSHVDTRLLTLPPKIPSFPLPWKEPNQNAVSESMFHRHNLESTCTYICNIWDSLLAIDGNTPQDCLECSFLVVNCWQSTGRGGVCVCVFRYTYVYVNVCMCLYVQMCRYICVHTCLCVCMLVVCV